MRYGGVSGRIVFWAVSSLALAIFLRRLYQLVAVMRHGRVEKRVSHVSARILTVISHVLGQLPQLRSLTPRDCAGLGHGLIAWGFFIFIGYYFLFIIVGDGLGYEGIKQTGIFYYYTWAMDMASPLIIAAALWGILRRYVVIPARLEGEQTGEALFILVTVLIHPATHLLKTATGIALGLPPVGSGHALPPLSGSVANLLPGTAGWMNGAHAVFFWLHWGTILLVLSYIPYSRYLHVIAAPFNIFFLPERSPGALRTLDLAGGEKLGPSRITDFSWKQMLDLYSCVVCGRCQDACPAYQTGKPLNPKRIVQTLYGQLLAAVPGVSDGVLRWHHVDALTTEDAGTAIDREAVQSCTTCAACVEVCPLSIDQTDKIIELRRSLVFEGHFDRGHQTALQRVAQNHNPWGISWNKRARNVPVEQAQEGKHYDCLYWIGCVSAFDETGQAIAEATAGLLRKAGVRFAMLGNREKCCGDFVRRLGDEGLFQQLARENISVLNRFEFDFVLTHCPHCFNVLANEYPDFGGVYKVVHHTRLIADILNAGKLKLHTSAEGVHYHDPCYLGRYNNLYEEPRSILRHCFSSVSEFPGNRRLSFCCGAGGGQVWKDAEAGSLISVKRIEEVLAGSGFKNAIATACPFCLLMFEEALTIKGLQNDVRVRDVAQLVESLSY
jgi:Fe-S oxidoreductase